MVHLATFCARCKISASNLSFLPHGYLSRGRSFRSVDFRQGLACSRRSDSGLRREGSDKKKEKRESGRERGTLDYEKSPFFLRNSRPSARENHPTPPSLAFLACGDFHARSPFARSTIPEEKW